MQMTILFSVIIFVVITLILVALLLFIKAKLTPSGKVKININDGSKIVELDLKGICKNENTSFYNENGVEYIPEENGKYKFTIAENTTEIKVFVTFTA